MLQFNRLYKIMIIRMVTVSDLLAVKLIYNSWRRSLFALRKNRLLRNEDHKNLKTLYRDALLIAHSFEKALCMKDCRDDFGTQKADHLLEYLILASKDPSFDNRSYAFVESMAALENWLARRARLGLDCSKWQHGFELLAQQTSYEVARIDLSNRAGVVSDSFTSVSDCDKNAINFINGRHSVRSFDSVPVSQEILKRVVELAQSAPSACNRQPSRVYFSGPKSAQVVSGAVRGNKGFEQSIFQWAVITADTSLFSCAEYDQWFINGGIYLQSFVLALKAYGIGSCIFQWVVGDLGKEMRSSLGISTTEAIIAVVGFGYPKETFARPVAQRMPVSEVASWAD